MKKLISLILVAALTLSMTAATAVPTSPTISTTSSTATATTTQPTTPPTTGGLAWRTFRCYSHGCTGTYTAYVSHDTFVDGLCADCLAPRTTTTTQTSATSGNDTPDSLINVTRENVAQACDTCKVEKSWRVTTFANGDEVSERRAAKRGVDGELLGECVLVEPLNFRVVDDTGYIHETATNEKRGHVFLVRTHDELSELLKGVRYVPTRMGASSTLEEISENINGIDFDNNFVIVWFTYIVVSDPDKMFIDSVSIVDGNPVLSATYRYMREGADPWGLHHIVFIEVEKSEVFDNETTLTTFITNVCWACELGELCRNYKCMFGVLLS